MNYRTNYNHKNKAFANELKHSMTKAEACIWKYALRAGKMRGYGFRRQSPILKYIVDFMCVELNLVIEVDGGIHENEQIKERDKIRQKDLEEHGYTVLRFKNEEVLCNINWVIDEIEKWIQNYELKNSIEHIPRPRWRHPQPPPGGGKDVE